MKGSREEPSETPRDEYVGIRELFMEAVLWEWTPPDPKTMTIPRQRKIQIKKPQSLEQIRKKRRRMELKQKTTTKMMKTMPTTQINSHNILTAREICLNIMNTLITETMKGFSTPVRNVSSLQGDSSTPNVSQIVGDEWPSQEDEGVDLELSEFLDLREQEQDLGQ